MLLGAIVAALVVLAAVRVAPFLTSEQAQEVSPEQRRVVRAITNSKTPEYDVESLLPDADLVHDRAFQKVRAALSELPAASRPGGDDAIRTTTVFADFLILNRTGSRQDALARYDSRGFEPRQELVQDDAERAEKAWKYSVAWARHAPIDIDAIEVAARFIQGRPVSEPRLDGAAISGRELRSGGFVGLQPHSYTVFEIIVPVVVPNIDGASEFPVDVCVSIANDMPGGAWDVVESTWRNHPSDKRFTLPYP